MTDDLVKVDRDGDVAVVSLNRPERHNAINDAMSQQIERTLAATLAEDSVRAIVLRGEGRSFCSGRDTSVLGQRQNNQSDYDFVLDHQERAWSRLFARKPIIAAMHGVALGGGFEMALQADVRVASTTASMGFPEANYGLMTDTGGSALVTTLAGPSRAKYLVMSGQRIDAATALNWGLVDWVVEPDDLTSTAIRIAHEMTATTPSVSAYVKATVNGMIESSIRGGMQAELLAQVGLFAERRSASQPDRVAVADQEQNSADR